MVIWQHACAGKVLSNGGCLIPQYLKVFFHMEVWDICVHSKTILSTTKLSVAFLLFQVLGNFSSFSPMKIQSPKTSSLIVIYTNSNRLNGIKSFFFRVLQIHVFALSCWHSIFSLKFVPLNDHRSTEFETYLSYVKGEIVQDNFLFLFFCLPPVYWQLLDDTLLYLISKRFLLLHMLFFNLPRLLFLICSNIDKKNREKNFICLAFLCAAKYFCNALDSVFLTCLKNESDLLLCKI